MNENLSKTKARIKSVKSIQKITKAMKLIAQSRFNKLKRIIDDNTEYFKNMNLLVGRVFNRMENEKKDLYQLHPSIIPTCLKEFEGNTKTLYIYITSTLGLSGSYYYNLNKMGETYLNKDVDCIFIGEKGYKHFKNKVDKAYDEYIYLQDVLDYDLVNFFRHDLDRIYRENRYKEIRVIYTHFISTIKFETRNIKLFPLNLETIYTRILDIKKDDEILDFKKDDTTFEGSIYELSDKLVSHYLDEILFRLLLESSISEQSSRMNSMEEASKSADKLLNELRLRQNKLRQTRITSEISEIVSNNQNELTF